MSEHINPNENLRIPEWITAEYFDQILKSDGVEYTKISKFTPVAAIPPGENFTSILIRVHLYLDLKDGTKNYKSYIMKTMLDDDCGGSDINRLELFPKELDMYGEFLPAFERLYKDAGKEVQFAPRCLLAERRENRINFVFEDLAVKGFKNADRMKGLNMDEMRRALHKLAEFHAASVVYAEQKGPYPKAFNFSFVQKDDYEYQKHLFLAKNVEFKEAMKTWGVEKYLEKFPTFDQYWKCILRVFNTEENSFNVLNHADFWSSNVMYKYLENGTVDDAIIIDYQICKWGSPAEDLIFFLTISPAKDIRIKEYEHFVAIYHEHLIDCLKLLDYKKPLPKLRDLQMDMYRENNGFYAFFPVINHLLLVLFPSDKDSNVVSLLSKDENGRRFRMKIFTNPAFKDAMLDIFKFYHNRGVFNFSDYDN